MNTSLNTPTVQLAKTPQFSCVIRAKVKELNTSIQNKIKGFYQGLINHLKVARSNNNEEENIQWLVEIQTDFRSAFETQLKTSINDMLDDIFNKELQLIRDNPSIELQAKNAYKNELQLLREQVVYALKENLGCIRTECINTYKNFLTANGLENPTAHCKAAERTHTT